jgi:uncharacterized membrane protein YbhN (UPF0104 family)
VIRAAGLLLGAASIVWLWLRLRGSAAEALDGLGSSWRVLIPAIPAFVLLLLLQATAWWLLCRTGRSRPSWRAATSVWGRSQPAKYLPGNVMHFLGRQLFADEMGVRQGTVAVATVLEQLCMMAGALALGSLAVVAGRGPGPDAAPWGLFGALAALVALVLLAPPVRRAVVGVWPGELPDARRLLDRCFRASILCFVVHLGTGAILFWLLRSIATGTDAGAVEVVASYGLAWAGGLVAIGVPGGLGVREALLVYLLDGRAPAAELTAAALALRLVTMAGEGLIFAVGLNLRSRSGSPQ